MLGKLFFSCWVFSFGMTEKKMERLHTSIHNGFQLGKLVLAQDDWKWFFKKNPFSLFLSYSPSKTLMLLKSNPTYSLPTPNSRGGWEKMLADTSGTLSFVLQLLTLPPPLHSQLMILPIKFKPEEVGEDCFILPLQNLLLPCLPLYWRTRAQERLTSLLAQGSHFLWAILGLHSTMILPFSRVLSFYFSTGTFPISINTDCGVSC